MEMLGKIFGSQTKVRIIRLFLFNPEKVFDTREIAKRCQSSVSSTTREMRPLVSAGLIRKKSIVIGMRRVGAKEKQERKLKLGWALDLKFPYLNALQTLVINTVLIKDEEILNRLAGTGQIKLVVVAGVFIQDAESRVDLLVVGDRLKKTLIESRIKKMESEIGKELRYSIFETPDFQYRVSIYDKLARDILEYKHKKIIDKIGVRAPFTPFASSLVTPNQVKSA